MKNEQENNSLRQEEIATTFGIPAGEKIDSLSVDELAASLGLTGDEEADFNIEGT